jgi:hypothetical protein
VRNLVLTRSIARLLLCCCIALASAPSAWADDATLKQQAKQHFDRGLELIRQQAWGPALAEFLRSRELFATRGNTLNAGLALAKLGRHAEALELFETLLRDYPDIPAGERRQVEAEVAELRKRVGFVQVENAPRGATVMIDGVVRGTTPLDAPIRVDSGTHLVRVFRSGAVPFEARVDVAGGELKRVQPTLPVLEEGGRLKVIERAGQPAEVLVDGVLLGRTPWEGDLSPGRHAVTLRGPGKLGTQPASAPIRAGATTVLRLSLEPLECELKVEPEPINANVAIDRVDVGRGGWQGRLRCGAHRVEVAAEGFLPERRSVQLSPRRAERVEIALDRDPEAELWASARPSRVFIELNGGAALGAGFGGDLADACTAECDASLPFGWLLLGRGGYQLRSGLAAALEVGYLRVGASFTGRPIDALTVPDGQPLQGAAEDALALRAFLAGVSGSYHAGDDWPVGVRLNVGVLIGALEDRRSASLSGAPGSGQYPPSNHSHPARYLYLAPEIHVGRRFGDFELALGVRPMLLVAITQPSFESDQRVADGGLGFFRFQPETLTAQTLFLVSPTLSLRYGFF